MALQLGQNELGQQMQSEMYIRWLCVVMRWYALSTRQGHAPHKFGKTLAGLNQTLILENQLD